MPRIPSNECAVGITHAMSCSHFGSDDIGYITHATGISSPAKLMPMAMNVGGKTEKVDAAPAANFCPRSPCRRWRLITDF